MKNIIFTIMLLSNSGVFGQESYSYNYNYNQDSLSWVVPKSSFESVGKIYSFYSILTQRNESGLQFLITDMETGDYDTSYVDLMEPQFMESLGFIEGYDGTIWFILKTNYLTSYQLSTEHWLCNISGKQYNKIAQLPREDFLYNYKLNANRDSTITVMGTYQTLLYDANGVKLSSSKIVYQDYQEFADGKALFAYSDSIFLKDKIGVTKFLTKGERIEKLCYLPHNNAIAVVDSVSITVFDSLGTSLVYHNLEKLNRAIFNGMKSMSNGYNFIFRYNNYSTVIYQVVLSPSLTLTSSKTKTIEALSPYISPSSKGGIIYPLSAKLQRGGVKFKTDRIAVLKLNSTLQLPQEPYLKTSKSIFCDSSTFKVGQDFVDIVLDSSWNSIAQAPLYGYLSYNSIGVLHLDTTPRVHFNLAVKSPQNVFESGKYKFIVGNNNKFTLVSGDVFINEYSEIGLCSPLTDSIYFNCNYNNVSPLNASLIFNGNVLGTNGSYAVSQTGIHKIYNYNAAGNVISTYSTYIQQKAPSQLTVGPLGPVILCKDMSYQFQVLHLSTKFNNATFQWFRDSVLLINETQSIILANTPGKYYCQIQKGNCTFTTTNVTEVIVATPTLSPFSPVSISMASGQYCIEGVEVEIQSNTGYRKVNWYKNGEPAVLPSSGKVLIAQDGTYYAVCESVSNCIIENTVKKTYSFFEYDTIITSHINDTLFAKPSHLQYTWYDENFNVISQQHKVLVRNNGIYAVYAGGSPCIVQAKEYYFNALSNLQLNNLSNVDFYPNPVADLLTIDLSHLSKTHGYLTLYNSKGQEVLNLELQHAINTISCASLEQGVYTAILKTNQNVGVTKLVVVH